MVIGTDDDEYGNKIYALTAGRIVVLTEGSAADDLFEHALGVSRFDDLIAETTARQLLIEKAITEYMVRTKNKNLVIPNFPAPPMLSGETPAEPQFRALAVANYVAALWSRWLFTEEQRLRRTTDPRTGRSPWIMPEELASPEVLEFPPRFAEVVQPEPLRAC
ncbi:MAG: hypothetical protein R2763_01210 [Mycobacterium sp.]